MLDNRHGCAMNLEALRVEPDGVQRRPRGVHEITGVHILGRRPAVDEDLGLATAQAEHGNLGGLWLSLPNRVQHGVSAWQGP